VLEGAHGALERRVEEGGRPAVRGGVASSARRRGASRRARPRCRAAARSRPSSGTAGAAIRRNCPRPARSPRRRSARAGDARSPRPRRWTRRARARPFRPTAGASRELAPDARKGRAGDPDREVARQIEQRRGPEQVRVGRRARAGPRPLEGARVIARRIEAVLPEVAQRARQLLARPRSVQSRGSRRRRTRSRGRPMGGIVSPARTTRFAGAEALDARADLRGDWGLSEARSCRRETGRGRSAWRRSRGARRRIARGRPAFTRPPA
jgi:hypothetical protein